MAKPKKIGIGGEFVGRTNRPWAPRRKTSPSQSANATVTTGLTLEWWSLSSEATFSWMLFSLTLLTLALLSSFVFICFFFHSWIVAFYVRSAPVSTVTPSKF
jgi:hypothetical protein